MKPTTIQTKVMAARFPGTCKRCNGGIKTGDLIEWAREIGALHQTCPPKEQQATQAEPEQLVPGVYETTEGIFVVKYNREKTNLYAKRLVELNGDYRTTEAGERASIDFVYEAGAVKRIKLADRMPVERAKHLTTLYGRCIACGRFLVAAKSVENGIGPVCIKNFGSVFEVVSTTADGREIVRAA